MKWTRDIFARLLSGALSLAMLLPTAIFSVSASEREAVCLSVNRPATVSSDSGGWGSTPGKINDGNNDTFWESDFTQGSTLQWCQIDLQRPCEIKYITLYVRDNSVTERSNIQVQASNDPTFETYDVIGERGADPIAGGSIWRADCSLDGKYRYVRLTQTQTGYFLLCELSVYGFEQALQMDECKYTIGSSPRPVENLRPTGVPGAEFSLRNTCPEPYKATMLLTLTKGTRVLDAAIVTRELAAESSETIRLTLSNLKDISESTGISYTDMTLRGYVLTNVEALELAALAAAPIGAEADETNSAAMQPMTLSVDYEEAVLHTQGGFENAPKANVLSVILAPDAEGNAVEALAEDGSNIDSLYALYYGTISNEGGYAFDTPIENIGGMYHAAANAYYQGKTLGVQETEVFCGNEAIRETALGEFFAAANSDSLAAALNTYGTNGTMPIINYNTENVYYTDSMAEFYSYYNKIRPENVWLSVAALERALLSSEALTCAKQEKITEEFLTAYGDALEFVTNKFYNEKVKEEIAKLMEENKPQEAGFADKADIQKAFEASLILAVINKATRESMTEIVEFYKDDLELDYGEFEPVLVNKMLVNGDFKSVSAFQKAFDERIDELKAEKEAEEAEKEKEEENNKRRPSGGGGKRLEIYAPAVTPPPAETTQPAENTQLPFEDLAQAEWAEEGIRFLFERGVKGRAEKEFAPNENIRREEGVKMLLAALNIIPAKESVSSFSDVTAEDWFYPFVTEAETRAIIGGMGDGSFGVGLPLTRQDFAVIIYRLIGESAKAAPAFTDSGEIAEYAQQAVAYLAERGIVSGMGDGKFLPRAAITRAQAAKILYEAFGKEAA